MNAAGSEPDAGARLAAASAGFPPPPVDIRDLSFLREGDVVLDHVNLLVNQGEVLALIGPNGGGKTTLLRLMLGLLRPHSGEVRVFGGDPEDMGRHIGYVPQYAGLQTDFPATVLEMVLMGAAAPTVLGGGWNTGSGAREAALGYLDVLGIADCARRPIRALSGGQRQRALVARALMGRQAEKSRGGHPFLLLLDEPTASIDPKGKFCFYEFLGKLRGGITIIVVSHDLFMATPFFDRVALVNGGLTVLEDGGMPPDILTALFGRHAHECPVGDWQHSSGAQHSDNCTHPACARGDAAPPDAHGIADFRPSAGRDVHRRAAAGPSESASSAETAGTGATGTSNTPRAPYAP